MESEVTLDKDESQVLPLNKFHFKSILDIHSCEKETIVGKKHPYSLYIIIFF